MQDIVGVASVVAALLTWSASHWYTWRKDRISYSANLVANISTNEILAEADFFMAAAIKNGVKISESEDRTLDEETDRKVMVLLDYYEYLATMYFTGAADKETIRHLRGGAMYHAFAVCEGYIAYRQEVIGDYLYNDLRRFVSTVDID